MKFEAGLGYMRLCLIKERKGGRKRENTENRERVEMEEEEGRRRKQRRGEERKREGGEGRAGGTHMSVVWNGCPWELGTHPSQGRTSHSCVSGAQMCHTGKTIAPSSSVLSLKPQELPAPCSQPSSLPEALFQLS